MTVTSTLKPELPAVVLAMTLMSYLIPLVRPVMMQRVAPVVAQAARPGRAVACEQAARRERRWPGQWAEVAKSSRMMSPARTSAAVITMSREITRKWSLTCRSASTEVPAASQAFWAA